MSKDSTIILKEKWLDGFKKDTSIIYNISYQPSHFAIDYKLVTTDFNFYHHLSKSAGPFKFQKRINLKLIPINTTNNKVNHIYWAPLFGWNSYDKIMPGLAIYNKGIKTKKTEWVLSPLYSFENSSLNGIGEINHYHNINKWINRLEFGYKIRSFSSRFESSLSNDRWIRQEVFSELSLKENKLRYSPSHKILLRAIRIDDHLISGNLIFPPESISQIAYYGQIQYSLKNKQILKPKSLQLKYTYGFNKNYNLVSSLELTSKIKMNYNQNLDALKIRFYAGYNFNTFNSRYNLFIRGQDGYYDYLYDRIYLGRNLNYPYTLAQQSSNSQGSFKINTGLGSSDSWLITSNISLKLPNLPLSLFSDIGTYPSLTYNANIQQTVLETQFLYNFGLSFKIEILNKNFIVIYLPLTYSEAIKNSFVPGTNKQTESLSLLQKITFVFNLNVINPFSIKNNIRP